VTLQPLSEAEFESLSEALERLGGRAMNLEQLDGFLASLVCSPEEVSLVECLREVCGFDVMNHSEAASCRSFERFWSRATLITPPVVCRHWRENRGHCQSLQRNRRV